MRLYFILLGLLLSTCFVEAQQWQESLSINNFRSSAYNGSLYVIVGDNGKIMTSPDGVTWTKQNSGVTNTLYDVAYGGGKWVVSGYETIMYSTDGITWTKVYGGGGIGYFGVDYYNGLWIAVGNFGWSATSTDGINWTGKVIGPSIYHGSGGYLNAHLSDVKSNESLWVAVGLQGSIISSPDGTNWTRRYSSGFSKTLSHITYDNGQWVAVGEQGSILISPDGVTWTQQTSGVTQNLSSVNYKDGTWVIVGAGGVILTSSDGGITWTQRTSGVTQTLNSVSVENELWVVRGAENVTLTSSDGITWESSKTVLPKNLNDVAYGNNLWVAVGENGLILTSNDGQGNWEKQQTDLVDNVSLKAIGYGNGLWIAGGNITKPSGGVEAIMFTSTDAKHWVRTGNLPLMSYVNDVFFNGSLWVSASFGIYTSPDGITWSMMANTPDGGNYQAVTYANGQWVAAGYKAEVKGSILTSSDGVIWTERMMQTAYFPFYDIAYGNGRWVATGDAVATSTDGINWTLLRGGNPQQAPAANYKAIASNGIKWIQFYANNNLRQMAASNAGVRTEISSDGINWTTGNSPIWGNPNAITYSNGMWMVVGSNFITYITDTALPLSLLSFQARSEETATYLTWKTAWEKGTSHFLVERSTNAKAFEAIGRVEASGNSEQEKEYSFQDTGLASGIWYYRLKSMDQDATFTYSQIISVRINDNNSGILALYPNPSNGIVTIEDNIGIDAIHIYSSNGLLLRSQVFEQSTQKWQWDSVGWSSGVYLIKVQATGKSPQLLRWIKQ